MRTGLEAKPSRRMIIENDSLYLDDCLTKKTCQVLNSLNEQELSFRSTDFFFAELDHSIPLQTSASGSQVDLPSHDIDHLISLYLAKETKLRGEEETPHQESNRDENFLTISDFQRGEKDQLQNRQENSGNSILSPRLLLHLKNSEKSRDTKNIACYISRFVSRTMLSRYDCYLKARCIRAGVDWSEFKEFCDPKKLRGINSLVPFFSSSLNEAERKKKEIFNHLFQKILRRHYLRLIQGQGHMISRELYIQFKNKQLLYCESALPS